MAPLDAPETITDYEAPVKDLYEVGEIPPLGHVPAKMYAWAIRRERHGKPYTAMQLEVVETPKLDSNEVLLLNRVWFVSICARHADASRDAQRGDERAARVHRRLAAGARDVMIGGRMRHSRVGQREAVTSSCSAEATKWVPRDGRGVVVQL